MDDSVKQYKTSEAQRRAVRKCWEKMLTDPEKRAWNAERVRIWRHENRERYNEYKRIAYHRKKAAQSAPVNP